MLDRGGEDHDERLDEKRERKTVGRLAEGASESSIALLIVSGEICDLMRWHQQARAMLQSAPVAFPSVFFDVNYSVR